MLSRILALSLVVTFPASVCAQTATTTNEAATSSDTDLAPLPPAADALAAPSSPAQPDSTLDEPITKIADTTGGCAILDKDFPGLRTHPMYAFFKSMSLNQIAAMSHGQITPDMLTQAQTDLSALNIKVGAAIPMATVASVPATTAAPVALTH
jgi:hypothetical protein